MNAHSTEGINMDIRLFTDEITLRNAVGGIEGAENFPGGNLLIGCGLDSIADRNFPYLQLVIEPDYEETASRMRLSVKLMEYAEIDALRRYCEMVLAHFDKGILV